MGVKEKLSSLCEAPDTPRVEPDRIAVVACPTNSMPTHTLSAHPARRVKAGDRQRFLRRKDRKTIRLGAAGYVVRVDRVRNRLEAEEVRLMRRRIDDVDRKRGLC